LVACVARIIKSVSAYRQIRENSKQTFYTQKQIQIILSVWKGVSIENLKKYIQLFVNQK
jgi:hypothetical protein